MDRHRGIAKREASDEYRSWQAMRSRCHNPMDKEYSRYGGAGIDVCSRWDDFIIFLHDMGRKPSGAHTLDRIDSTKGYSKANCRWATREEQSRNRRTTKITLAIAEEIRNLYATGEYTQGKLGAKYDLPQTSISDIVRGKTWKK